MNSSIENFFDVSTGVVDSRSGLGQQYYIKWLDGGMCKQNSNHIFDLAHLKMRHEDWEYILAPCEHNNKDYIPVQCKVVETSPLKLSYYDNNTGRYVMQNTHEANAYFYDHLQKFPFFPFLRANDII